MKNRNILDYLFFCIIINLIPFALRGFLDNMLYTVLVLLAYAIQTIVMCLVVREKIKEISKKPIIIIAIFFVLQVIALLISYFRWNHFDIQDIAYMFSVTINLFIYLYLCTKFEVTKEEFLLFMKRLIIVGLIACIYNFIINWRNILNLFNVENSYSLNICSFFSNRNTFGMFLLIMIISTLYILINKRSKSYIAILIFFIINLLLTMSRTSILGMGILIFLLILLNGKDIIRKMTKKQKILISIIVGFIIIIATILLVTIPEIWETINRLFLRTGSSNITSDRSTIWKNGIDIFKNNPIIGVGKFQAIYLNNTVYNSSYDSFHSIYVESLVTYGIVGLIGLGCIITWIIKKVKNSEINKKTKKLMLSSIIVFLVISCLETTGRFSIGYVDTINMIYYFTVPLIYSNKKTKKEVPDGSETKEDER